MKKKSPRPFQNYVPIRTLADVRPDVLDAVLGLARVTLPRPNTLEQIRVEIQQLYGGMDLRFDLLYRLLLKHAPELPGLRHYARRRVRPHVIPLSPRDVDTRTRANILARATMVDEETGAPAYTLRELGKLSKPRPLSEMGAHRLIARAPGGREILAARAVARRGVFGSRS